MSDAVDAGNVSGTAVILLTEAIIEVLRRKGMLDSADIQRAFILASSEAAKLPTTHISRQKVFEILGALQSRARHRAQTRQPD
jgi:hypothetical protein